MTDAELIAKKLAMIETCQRELRELGRLDRIRSDVRERRFVEHTLQIAIQAVLDIASHIVSDERLGEPETNRELFELLARAGWLDRELSEALQRMAGFRNILVHGYAHVDLGIVEQAVTDGLGDLEAFVAAVRVRL